MRTVRDASPTLNVADIIASDAYWAQKPEVLDYRFNTQYNIDTTSTTNNEADWALHFIKKDYMRIDGAFCEQQRAKAKRQIDVGQQIADVLGSFDESATVIPISDNEPLPPTSNQQVLRLVCDTRILRSKLFARPSNSPQTDEQFSQRVADMQDGALLAKPAEKYVDYSRTQSAQVEREIVFAQSTPDGEGYTTLRGLFLPTPELWAHGLSFLPGQPMNARYYPTNDRRHVTSVIAGHLITPTNVVFTHNQPPKKAPRQRKEALSSKLGSLLSPEFAPAH